MFAFILGDMDDIPVAIKKREIKDKNQDKSHNSEIARQAIKTFAYCPRCGC